MKFAFIKNTLALEYDICACCRVLDVSESGYHRFVAHPESKREQWRARMTDVIKHEFEGKRRVYGSHKIFKELRKRSVEICENSVAKLMSHGGIRSIRVKKFKPKTTDSNHDLLIADNIVNREFNVAVPNTVWAGDITYIHTDAGILYLAGVIDLFSRRVVGYSMAEHMRATLVCDAMNMAMAQRHYPKGLLFHSDRGSQYAGDEFRKLLKDYKVTASMSNVGDCYDNAVVESLWSNLKKELIFHRKFATFEEARTAIFEYIEAFYNRERIHNTLGDLSPAEFEAAFASHTVAT